MDCYWYRRLGYISELRQVYLFRVRVRLGLGLVSRFQISAVRTGVCVDMDATLLATTLKIIIIVIIIIMIIIIYCSVSNKVRLFLYNIYIINLL